MTPLQGGAVNQEVLQGFNIFLMQAVSALAAELAGAREEAERRMAKGHAELAAVRTEAAARAHDLEGQLVDARISIGTRIAGLGTEAQARVRASLPYYL